MSATAPAAPAGNESGAGMNSLRVLLVEDHPAQRSLLRKMLGLIGVTAIAEAASGREAIALLRERGFDFDLIVTDLRMPDGDGLDVVHALPRNSTVRKVVLLTSAEDDIVSALHSLPEEINGSRLLTVAKPIALKQLEDIARRTLQRRQQRRDPRSRWPAERLELALWSGEIRAHLEPQFDLRRGEVIGFEALAGWHHPEQGLLAPAEFLPELEESGLMVSLTLCMMESALKSLAPLRAAGYDGGLSVNFGARCLEDSEFPGRMAALARRAGEPCENITLELTETAQAEGSMLEVSNLARLRLEGFLLAIDDFGMGYASLAKLRRGAFNEIKIDREFTLRVASDRTSRAAVESIVALARSLDVSCIAEGIENEEARQWLLEIGCQQGQGYLLSRPLAPDRVVAWWRGHSERVRSAAALRPQAADALADKPATLDDRALDRLGRRDHPAWIFDLDQLRMVWGNAAALKFWGAADLDALTARDYRSDMSISTRHRLQAYRQQLSGGKAIPERWTLYPGGKPGTLDCLITGLYAEDGRSSMLVEALPPGSLIADEHYEAESARAAGVAILLTTPDGEVVWQNPASAHLHGAAVASVAALIGNAGRADSLLAQALADGEAICETEVTGTQGGSRRRLIVRRTRDRGNGRMLMAITVV